MEVKSDGSWQLAFRIPNYQQVAIRDLNNQLQTGRQLVIQIFSLHRCILDSGYFDIASVYTTINTGLDFIVIIVYESLTTNQLPVGYSRSQQISLTIINSAYLQFQKICNRICSKEIDIDRYCIGTYLFSTKSPTCNPVANL